MMNLFSSFEPPMNIFMLILLISVTSVAPKTKWNSFNPYYSALSMLKNSLMKENKMIFSSLLSKSNMFTPLFMLITLNNVTGLLPYTFATTAHMSLNLPLAFSLWLVSFLFPIIMNIQMMKAHFVPLGTPTAMSPFMVCVEIISLMIRPITLSVRLTANIIAGHLILTLISNLAHHISHLNIKFLLTLLKTSLMTLESMVALIQAYVFMMLSSLYISETMNYVKQGQPTIPHSRLQSLTTKS